MCVGCTGAAAPVPNAVYTIGPESQAFPQAFPWVSFDTRATGTVTINSVKPRLGDGSLELATTCPDIACTTGKAQVHVIAFTFNSMLCCRKDGRQGYIWPLHGFNEETRGPVSLICHKPRRRQFRIHHFIMS